MGPTVKYPHGLPLIRKGPINEILWRTYETQDLSDDEIAERHNLNASEVTEFRQSITEARIHRN